MMASLETKGTGNDDQGSNLYHVLHGSHWVHRRGHSGKGVGAVKSYRDYLAMKGLQPIVIHRTAKSKGDKVIVTSCKPAETVK